MASKANLSGQAPGTIKEARAATPTMVLQELALIPPKCPVAQSFPAPARRHAEDTASSTLRLDRHFPRLRSVPLFSGCGRKDVFADGHHDDASTRLCVLGVFDFVPAMAA